MSAWRDRLAVCADPAALDARVKDALNERATRLAGELRVALVAAQDREHEMHLALRPDRLELRWLSQGRCRPVYVDFTHIDAATGAGRSKRQPIARAVGLNDRRGGRHGKQSDCPDEGPTVLDATAGLGNDSWLLASLGCRVIAVERHVVVAALLADGLRRARLAQPEIAERIELVVDDAHELLRSLAQHLEPSRRPEVVYLDPMFPPRKKAALERKQMRLLRRLVGDDGDADDLLALSRQAARRRVVVKRQLHAPCLGASASGGPVSQHKGKAARYDVYAALVR